MTEGMPQSVLMQDRHFMKDRLGAKISSSSCRSVTGVCMGSTSDSLMAINWRTKTVTEISYDGNTIGSFTHDDFK